MGILVQYCSLDCRSPQKVNQRPVDLEPHRHYFELFVLEKKGTDGRRPKQTGRPKRTGRRILQSDSFSIGDQHWVRPNCCNYRQFAVTSKHNHPGIFIALICTEFDTHGRLGTTCPCGWVIGWSVGRSERPVGPCPHYDCY